MFTCTGAGGKQCGPFVHCIQFVHRFASSTSTTDDELFEIRDAIESLVSLISDRFPDNPAK